jgi:UDP-glucose 4-epimerase
MSQHVKNSRSRILITGGAGFIGSHLVDKLIEANQAVTVLDNFSTGSRRNLEQAQKNGDVRIIEGSVLDMEALDAAMDNCDIVFHLAVECVRRSLAHPLENHHTNATGTINTLEMARRKNISRFIYCSSSEVYGNGVDALLNEDKTVCQPTTVYGAAKLAGEYYTKAYHRTYQLPIIIARPFNAYGPRAHCQGERAEVIPRFIIRLLNNLPPIIFGNGKSARDFTYVTEVAEGLSLLMNDNNLIGREVNLAFGRVISINEIAHTVAKICGNPHLEPTHIEARPGDIYSLHADTHLANNLLGFKAKIHFEEGLMRYLNWFKITYPNVALLLEKETVNWKVAQ